VKPKVRMPISNTSKPDDTPPTWTYDKLDSPAKIIQFIGEVPRLIFEGKISARTAGALNGAVRNLMTCYGLGDYQLEELRKRVEQLESYGGMKKNCALESKR